MPRLKSTPMPKIKVIGQTVQAGEHLNRQMDGHCKLIISLVSQSRNSSGNMLYDYGNWQASYKNQYIQHNL